MKRMIAVVSASLLLGVPSALIPTTSAQELIVPAFPAAALIRGENIRLRVDPAAAADEVAIMQRGDEITITGEPVSADGFTFYPIELVATGERGWVRDLFINPYSITAEAGATLPAAPTAAPANEQPRRNRNNRNNEVTPTPEPTAEANNADRQARRAARQQQQQANQAQQEATAGNQAATPAPVESTPTPTPVPPVTAAASVAGVGEATSNPIRLEPGRYRATASMQVPDKSRFTATLQGPNDFSEELFDERIDTPQAWTAGKVVRIKDAGDYTVQVTNATEAWSIAFEPLPARS